MSAVLQLAGCGMVHGMNHQFSDPAAGKSRASAYLRTARSEGDRFVPDPRPPAEGKCTFSEFRKVAPSVCSLDPKSDPDRQADHG
jgi:hypothetical protein